MKLAVTHWISPVWGACRSRSSSFILKADPFPGELRQLRQKFLLRGYNPRVAGRGKGHCNTCVILEREVLRPPRPPICVYMRRARRYGWAWLLREFGLRGPPA